MLILILINVHHSRKAVFSFEKGSNHQNHSSSGSLQPVIPPPHLNFKSPPLGGGGGIYPPSPPLTAIWKTLLKLNNIDKSPILINIRLILVYIDWIFITIKVGFIDWLLRRLICMKKGVGVRPSAWCSDFRFSKKVEDRVGSKRGQEISWEYFLMSNLRTRFPKS